MTRDEIPFQTGYSIRPEHMQSMLLARLERASHFLLMTPGAAIAARAASVPSGLGVFVLAMFLFVWQPGTKSVLASAQKQNYENLRAKIDDLPKAGLQQGFALLQENDSQTPGCLCEVACMGEMIRRGITPDFSLTWLQKVMAFMAGDLPRQ